MTSQIPTSQEFIDKIIRNSMQTDRRFRYDSDVADAIGVSRSTLSQYRQGTNMSVLVAVKIAKLLNTHPMETIAATMEKQAEKAGKEDERQYWQAVYTKYYGQRDLQDRN